MSNLKENTTYSQKLNVPSNDTTKQIFGSSSSAKSVRPSAAVKSARLSSSTENPVSASAQPVEDYSVIGEQPVNGFLPERAFSSPAPADYPSWRGPSLTPPQPVPVGAKFANLSKYLGGGQFAQTPEGATDLSVKSIEKFNSLTRDTYIPGIAGIGGGAMQIDHIVPVWLDGTDTEDNKQVLGIKDHLQKTKLQEIVRALYSHKIIGKKEALNYAINWKNLPGADEVDMTPVDQASKNNKLLQDQGLPTKPLPTINVDVAKKIFNEWKNPSTDLGFMGSLKGIKDNWGDAVKKVQTAVNNTAVKFIPPATWDFVKGITEGYTGGWIKAGETPEASYGEGTIGKVDKTIGKVAKFAGNMVGSIIAWRTLTRVMQKGATILANPANATKIIKEGGALTNFLSGQTSVERAFIKGSQLLDNPVARKVGKLGEYMFSPAVKAAVAGDKISKAGTAAEKALAESALNATEIATVKQGTATATKIAKDGLAQMIASRDLGKLITMNVVVSNIFGQLSRPVEGENRLHRAMSDSVNGLIFGATPPGLRYAYLPAVLGAASTYIASSDPTAALQTGLMFGGMHALGAVSGPAAEESMISDAMKIARENAGDHIRSITGRELPVLPKPGASEKTVSAYKFLVDNEVQNAIDVATQSGKITTTNAANEIKRLKVVGQILKGEVDMQQVGWKEFGKTAEKDWAVFNTKDVGPADSTMSVRERHNTPQEAVSFFNDNPDLIVKDAEPVKIPVQGTTEAKQLGLDDINAQNFTHVQLTGVTEAADPAREANLKEFIRLVKENEMNPELYISRDRSLAPLIEALNKQKNQADIKAGKDQLWDPQNVLTAFYKHPETNEIKIVGVVPTPDRVGEVVIAPDGSRSVKGLPNSQNENAVKYNRPGTLDHTMNNETWVQEMKRQKVDTMKVSVDDFYEGKIGTNIGDISTKPYLHVSTSDTLWREAKYRNRNVATNDAKSTQEAIRSWQEQVKRGEKPVEMKSPAEVNKEFDKLIKNKKLNIPKDVASELTTADKTKIIRDYYARNTPKLAETIATVSGGKSSAKTAPEGSKPSLLNETLPTPPKTASKGQKVAETYPPQATPPDFLNPDIAPEPKLTVDSKPSTVKAPEPTAEGRQPAADGRQPAADGRQPAADGLAPTAKAEGVKAGKKSPKAWSTYDSETKINKGINDIVSVKYKDLYKTDKKAALELRQKAKTMFTREGDRTRAQNAFEKAGGTEYDGFGGFLKNTMDDLSSLVGKAPELTPEEVSVLHRQYNRLLQGHTRRSVTLISKTKYNGLEKDVVTINPSKADLLGEADRSILEFNKKHGWQKDSMEVIGIDDATAIKDYYGSKLSEVDRINNISESLAKMPEADGKTSQFIPLGKAAKGEKSTLAVKYNPDLVKMYDQTKHGGTNLNDQSKFLRVFAQDVLGLPKDTTADDFIKRSPLIFQRYEKYAGTNPNEKVTIHVVKSKSVKDAGGVDTSQFKNPESPADKEAIRIYGEAKEFDGKLVLGEDLFDRLVAAFNFGGVDKKGLKPILQGLVEVEGMTPGEVSYMIQKGHIIKADPAYRAHIKKQYGLDFGRNEGVSFAENVKIGPTEGKMKIPLKNFFMRPLQYENESGVGPSFYSKFSVKDGVTKDILNIDQKNITNLNDLVDGLSGAKTRAEIDAAFKGFEDKTGIDTSEFTYGEKEKIYENGAGTKRFAKDLQKLVKNLFSDTVYKPKVEDSKMLFLTPSIELKLDGHNKPERYLRSDEVVIGKKYAKYAKIKDGDQVIVKREPANHMSDYVYAKARIGDEMGATSLGDEHIMLSSHNTYVRNKGDHDGDAVAIFKVGEEYMPKSFADTIEKKGKYVLPIKEAVKRKKSELTDENLLRVMSSQLVGDDQTGAVSTMGRVVNLLKDNNAIIKIEAAPEGATKSQYQIIVNDVVVDSGTTLKLKKTIRTKIDWNENTDQLKQQVAQYALDSKGSDDIISKTATPDYPQGGDPLFMLKNAFIVKDMQGNIINKDRASMSTRIAKAISNTLKGYQDIFNVSQPDTIKSLDSLKGEKNSVEAFLKKATEMAKKIKKTGMDLHPAQERLLAMSELRDIPFNEADTLVADIAGRASVLLKLGDKVPEMSATAKEIVSKAKNARKRYNDRSLYTNKTDTPTVASQKKDTKEAIHQDVIDTYDKALEEGKLNEQDVEALAYWAATSPDGDISWGPTTRRKYVRRYDKFIGNSPEVSQTYYDAYEQAPRAGETDPADTGLSADELSRLSF